LIPSASPRPPHASSSCRVRACTWLVLALSPLLAAVRALLVLCAHSCRRALSDTESPPLRCVNAGELLKVHLLIQRSELLSEGPTSEVRPFMLSLRASAVP
jgi:hypothetical protein